MGGAVLSLTRTIAARRRPTLVRNKILVSSTLRRIVECRIITLRLRFRVGFEGESGINALVGTLLLRLVRMNSWRHSP